MRNNLDIELLQGVVYTLPYPTITHLKPIFEDNQDQLYENLYNGLPEHIRSVVDEDFTLFQELSNQVVDWYINIITACPRYISFFEDNITKREAQAATIEDEEKRTSKLRSIEEYRNKIFPVPVGVIKVVSEYISGNGSNQGFDAWLYSVAKFANMSILEVANLPYDKFIELNNLHTRQQDFELANDQQREYEEKRKKTVEGGRNG